MVDISGYEKIAVVLFVKNEDIDIPGWIAWYMDLGVDTLVTYEDGSSDRTREVILAASQIHDVRCRDVPEALHFQHRQQAVYLHAAETLKGEFQWIGFVDADEYVETPQHDDIHDFFAEFGQDVGAVSFNWKCFGSGGHVLRPSPNVTEQFTSRSHEEYYENATVKSFVRPEQMKMTYHDPHRFEVEGRTVNPLGVDVVWKEDMRHHTATIPDWSKGSFRHYAIRSAEHYIEKVKRRSDIRNNVDIGFFTWWDRNDVEDPIPEGKLGKLSVILYVLQHAIALERLASFHARKSVTNVPISDPGAGSPALFRVRSVFGTQIFVRRDTGRVVHALEGRPHHPSVLLRVD